MTSRRIAWPSTSCTTSSPGAQDARDYYAKEFADYRRKKPTPYMERLHFVPGTRDAADPDVRILSDKDLQAAVKEGEARIAHPDPDCRPRSCMRPQP